MTVRAETQIDLARVDDGTDGVSPTATVTKVGDTATITITDVNQTTTASVSDGTDGTNGVSVTAVEPQYYLSTSDSSATGGSWSSTPATFVSGRYYWTRDYITFSDGTHDTSTGVYNSGMTQAAQDAYDAKTLADDTNQYFWYAPTGTDTGAHITEVPQDEWNDSSDPNYHSGGNLLARSNGIAVRDGLEELSTFGVNGQTFNNKYGYAVFAVERGEASALSSKSDWAEYNNESPFSFTVPWDLDTNDYSCFCWYYDSNYQRVVITVPFTVTGRTLTFDATACATLQANNVKYISAHYNAVGEFPFYTMGSAGIGDVGAFSLREGMNTIASGVAAHAEGIETIAAGGRSHAEGWSTSADGSPSHAEGSSTQATASGAHAEGSSTKATATDAHAEGTLTEANGASSHAEGNSTQANGSNAHAEGSSTKANGSNSHAGGSGTIADGDYQTAIGFYNIQNGTPGAGFIRTNNLFIIGNGYDYNDRSNAFAVDGNGNVKAAGNFYATDHTNPIGWYDVHNNTTTLSNGTSFVKLNNSDITLAVGRYIITGSVRFNGATSGYRGITIRDSNGVIDRASVTQQTIPSSAWTTSLNTTIIYNAQSQTTVSLMAYQNSGSSLGISWDIYAICIK